MANEGNARRGLMGGGLASGYDSAGIADFIRNVSRRWADASDGERGMARQFLHDSGYDAGVPQVMDDGGNLVDDPGHASSAMPGSPQLDRQALMAARQYLD